MQLPATIEAPTIMFNELVRAYVSYRTKCAVCPEIIPMTRAKPDRRTKRTQRSLHVALNRLILEKGYDAITVHDLTERADVGRSTFYAHHGSKDGLLLDGLQHLRTALLAAQCDSLRAGQNSPQRALGFSRTFFEHVYEYRAVYGAIATSRSGPAVTRTMKRILSEVLRNEFAQADAARDGALPRTALVHFTVDALFSILAWWFEQNPLLAPAKADALFRRLVLPGLAAAGVR